MDEIKDIDNSLFNLATSGELWIAIGSICFLFVVMYIRKVVGARAERTFGKHRFGAQTDISVGLVYWFGNATGSDPFVLVSIDNDYLRFEDQFRIKYIPTKSFPSMEWTTSKILSREDVLDGSWPLRIKTHQP